MKTLENNLLHEVAGGQRAASSEPTGSAAFAGAQVYYREGEVGGSSQAMVLNAFQAVGGAEVSSGAIESTSMGGYGNAGGGGYWSGSVASYTFYSY